MMENTFSIIRRWSLLASLGLLLSGCVGMSLQDEIAGLMKQGESLYAEKKYDEALGKFSDVILKDPQYWRAYVWSARALVAKGSWSGAIKNAKKAFEMAPKGESVMPVLAEALLGGGKDALKNGRYADAIAYLREYLRHEPDDVQGWLTIGTAYLQSGDIDDTFKAFRKALNLDPGNSEALNFLRSR